ncbi:M20/M25/M40 family metallo-hydrolase [Pedobacter frigiditerrae]|uniref:M20/M25/M40 family metallo-hydrolase n=1 Tax=Pedobacter frigiditerrae TaxID=2530452 RepID=A0A4R0N2A6_9SPHI|nr:M20/M25/M40 family metallo-hydrolase [Pedobacter frigiditerrae]TCC93423.1 M20/M25/M40 family metallo-hydrolase [Pedobacter frigiditerrae]
MKYFKISLVFIFLASGRLFAQQTISRDPAISALVNEVSASNLESVIKKLVSFQTRHTLSDTLSKTTGIGAARSWIKSEFEKYGVAGGNRLQVSYDTFTQPADGRRITAPVVLKNVVAVLPGTDPNDKRMLMVSGHYDSRVTDVMNIKDFAPGANDDASGVAAVMEMCRIMSKQKFNSTLVFVAMVGEEQGLYGATNLAKRAKEEGWKVHLLMNNDIVGNSYGMETDIKDNKSVRVFSEGVSPLETPAQVAARQSAGTDNDGKARQAARYIKEVAERYVDQLEVKLIYRRDRFLRGGDHTPFSQQGFAAVRITEMNEDFNRQHQDVRTENGFKFGDLPEYVDYNYLQKVTRMNLSVMSNLALSTQEPENVVVLTAGLTNKTALKWDAPKGKTPIGYYVLMRETTSPFWEKKFFVKENAATLAYSKDNYYFGVQSVDENGHESLVITPRAGR